MAVMPMCGLLDCAPCPGEAIAINQRDEMMEHISSKRAGSTQTVRAVLQSRATCTLVPLCRDLSTCCNA